MLGAAALCCSIAEEEGEGDGGGLVYAGSAEEERSACRSFHFILTLAASMRLSNQFKLMPSARKNENGSKMNWNCKRAGRNVRFSPEVSSEAAAAAAGGGGGRSAEEQWAAASGWRRGTWRSWTKRECVSHAGANWGSLYWANMLFKKGGYYLFILIIYLWIVLALFYTFTSSILPCVFIRSFDAFSEKLQCQLSWEWEEKENPENKIKRKGIQFIWCV